MISVRSLCKRHGTRDVLVDVTAEVTRGETIAIVGPSGGGKSTLLRCLNYLEAFDGGTIEIAGATLRPGLAHGDPALRALRTRVGMVFQKFNLFPHLTALDNITLAPRKVHGVERAAAEERAIQLLDRVGLRDVASIQVRRLSGGQQQRLSLALSLVGRPELVFLDEPTAGMDPQARHATWGLLRELRAAGVTVVLTTHFLDEAEQLADSVVVVDAGRVVAAGTPAQLTRHGAEGQIRVRVSMGLRMTELREALPPGTRVAEQGDGRYLVTGEVTPQLLATLTAWLASQNILAEELAVERRSLEDVFLDLTGRAVRA